MRKYEIYWTKERCIAEALKYNSKVEFIKHTMSAYNSAIKHGWLEEITQHMIRPEPYNKKWTEKNCRQEALKYSSRVDFQNKSGSAYVAAHTNGWLNAICSHMVRPVRYNKKWTEKTCSNEALKYETRKEFNKFSKGAYLVALKMGILDKICSHMRICGSLMLRCVYVYEFSDNHVYVGLTFNSELRHVQHLTHLKSKVYKHIKNSGLIPTYKILSEYIDVSCAIQLEKNILNKYINDGWIKLNVAKTGGIGWIKISKKEK